MYIYKGKEILHPIYIHFLCGNKYNPEHNNDKREILKNYIDSIDNNYALILEKLFEIEEYKLLGFKDLEEVELMASHYARSIIILHETVSTAAEIALFGSKNELKNKILVVYAPSKKIETDNIGNFIKFAFFDEGKIINSEYNFYTKLYKYKNIAFYKTFFKDNKINDDFKKIIIDFWKKAPNVFYIPLTKENTLYCKDNTYSIDEKNKDVKLKLNYEFILSLLISIFLNNSLVKDKRNIEFIVQKVCGLYQDILKNTISNIEIKNLNDYKIHIKTIDNKDINLPIKFCIYILVKSELINIKGNNISITNDFKKACNEYKDLIVKKNDPDFFEVNKDE